MRANAAAAGCSIRTLNAVFRQFRETTPLAALHTIRLEAVRAELKHSVAEASSQILNTNPEYGIGPPRKIAVCLTFFGRVA
jgi:AraC-like DNA-binding protein